PYQRQRNKSLDAQDVPQTFSFTSVYTLPFGKGQRFLGNANGFISQLVSGRQANAVFRIQSETPFIFRSSECSIPSQFGMACIPSVLQGQSPFLTDPNGYDPNNGPLFNRASLQNGSNGGVFSFNPGDGPRTSNFRQEHFEKFDFVIEKNTNITER